MATKFWTSTSSNSFSTAANWSDGVAPVNGDTLIFNSLGTANVTTNLATTLTGLTIIVESTYTGQIGVLSGATATYLTVAAGTLYVGQDSGQGAGAGAPLVMVDFGASNTGTDATAYVYDSSPTSSSTFYPPVLIRNSSTNGAPPSVAVNIYGGSVGLAALAGDSTGANKFTVNATELTGVTPNVTPNVYIGRGATMTMIRATLGTIYARPTAAVTTINLFGAASMQYDGAGNITTLQIYDTATFLDTGTQSLIGKLTLEGTYRRRGTGSLTVGSASGLYLNAGCTYDVQNSVTATTGHGTITMSTGSIQDINLVGNVGEIIIS